MILVHDGDLEELRGMYDLTVSSASDNTLPMYVLRFYLIKALGALQSEAVFAPGHIRSLKPTVHNARIGELFIYPNLLVTHSEGAHRKDLSSIGNGASDHASSICVATLSKIFQNQCESHVFGSCTRVNHF